MKNNFIQLLVPIFIYSIFTFSIFSESNFNHPLWIEPASVYTKVRIDGEGYKKVQSSTWETKNTGRIEGEFAFNNLFSIKASGGQFAETVKGSRTHVARERWMLGMKFGKEFGSSSSAFAIGAGVKLLDRPAYQKESERAGVSQSFYLVRPNISMGLRFGNFEAHTEFRFQTETNSSFREGPLDEFKRHYQAGLGVSYGFLNIFRAYLETEYRHPYHKKHDADTLQWYFHPGIGILPYKGGLIAISATIPTMKKEYSERGGQLSFMHFF